jgi:hypothetical protein
VNKTRDEFPVTMKVEGMDGEIKVVGKSLDIKGESIAEGTFFVYLNKKDIHQRKTQVKIGLYSNDKKIKTIKTNFLGPVN